MPIANVPLETIAFNEHGQVVLTAEASAGQLALAPNVRGPHSNVTTNGSCAGGGSNSSCSNTSCAGSGNGDCKNKSCVHAGGQ